MTTAPRQVAFIVDDITDYQTLIAGIPAGIPVHVLDASGDALAQMAGILAAHEQLDAIHVFSHGSAAAAHLGSTVLNGTTLAAHAETLARIGASLTEDGDFLLYGCNVAQGEAGRAFVEDIARITRADVAASEDATGAAVLGGDWVLEESTGGISDTSTLEQSSFSTFEGLLALANNGSTGTVTFGTAASSTRIAGASTGMTANQIISVSNALSTGLDVYAMNANSASATNFSIFHQATSLGSDGAWLRTATNTGYTPQYLEFRANEGIFDLGPINLGDGATATGSFTFTITALDASFSTTGAPVQLVNNSDGDFTNYDLSGNTDFDGIYGFRISVNTGNSIGVDSIEIQNPRLAPALGKH